MVDNKRIYVMYKRIMKRDTRAIDDIKSLDEAKEIIKMIVGNQYLHTVAYQKHNEMMKK